MEALAIVALVVIAVIILVIVIAVQRTLKKSEGKGGGADIVSYLILALAMGVTGFALVELATTAFPGDQFIFDPAENVATSVAAIVVAAPFLIYFWRRQAERRVTYPGSSGWTLYLAIVKLVFLTAFVTSAVYTLDTLFDGGGIVGWPALLIFGVVVALHELAARRTPPRSDAADLPRVVGSAIGLVTGAVGLAGTLAALISLVFSLGGDGFDPWLAMVIVGVPVWAYQWLPKWEMEPALPHAVWSVLVTIISFAATIGTVVAMGVLSLQYLLGDTRPAGEHFETIPGLLGVFVTTLAIWAFHRRQLGSDRTNSLRSYEYASATIGLAGALVGAVALTVIAFDRSLLVGGGTNDVVAVTVTLVAGLAIWLVFSRRHRLGDHGDEAAAWPRRLYTLGVGAVLGLVAAGSLITTLFILLRRLLGEDDAASLVTPFSIFLYTALAAWYLLAAFGRDRETVASEEVITPFAVTIICAHPGPVATLFPEQAQLKVLHRGDGLGVIDEETAAAIVAAVGNQPSLVWVDEEGFRVAPMLVES